LTVWNSTMPSLADSKIGTAWSGAWTGAAFTDYYGEAYWQNDTNKHQWYSRTWKRGRELREECAGSSESGFGMCARGCGGKLSVPPSGEGRIELTSSSSSSSSSSSTYILLHPPTLSLGTTCS
jgi:hypothetical protein